LFVVCSRPYFLILDFSTIGPFPTDFELGLIGLDVVYAHNTLFGECLHVYNQVLTGALLAKHCNNTQDYTQTTSRSLS